MPGSPSGEPEPQPGLAVGARGRTQAGRTSGFPGAPVSGLVLTGGRSRRMGSDKSLLRVDGEALAERIGRLVASVADPVVEVGPGRSGLATVAERVPGGGPFLAVLDGWDVLVRSVRRPVVVVACDLPLLDRAFLVWLATHGSDRSVVPMLAGEPQPLCARWRPDDLDRMAVLAARGARSFRQVYDKLDVETPSPEAWQGVGLPDGPDDLDTPEDIQRLGLVGRVAPGAGGCNGPTTTMEG
ncbi:MAG: molybdenum cofactor guanylyltransferase [Acidimicrobiales bacterium]